MKNKIIKISILILSVLVFACCTNKITEYSNENFPINMVSFTEYYEAFSEKARQWDDDAYLVNAEINVFSNTYSGHEQFMEARYYSPNKSKESLKVILNNDGTIVSKTTTHQTTILQIEPININSQFVDSLEVILLLDNKDEVIRSIMNNNECKLLLARNINDVNNKFVWILIPDFGKSNMQKYFIDAKSGERISIDRQLLSIE